MSGFDAARLERIREHFERYVDDGRLPGFLVASPATARSPTRRWPGRRDLEAGAPVEEDTLWRIFSMTKPITSVAAMMLWEEGRFELKDPVARFLPEFAEPRVFAGGAMAKVQTVPAVEPIRMWHLLTHTSGLTYGFHHHGAGRRALPRGRARVGQAAGQRPRRLLRAVGASCRCSSSPAPSGTTASPPTSSGA